MTIESKFWFESKELENNNFNPEVKFFLIDNKISSDEEILLIDSSF